VPHLQSASNAGCRLLPSGVRQYCTRGGTCGKTRRSTRPSCSRTPNTLAGHKLLWLADEQNCQGALAEKLFRAYFVEGRDVGDVRILTDIGVEVGLMPKDIAEALSGEVAAAAVTLEEEHARRTGIRGVPTFMVQGKPLHL
jgi:predicted DsbA family dithiol-disulfide isomerase